MGHNGTHRWAGLWPEDSVAARNRVKDNLRIMDRRHAGDDERKPFFTYSSARGIINILKTNYNIGYLFWGHHIFIEPIRARSRGLYHHENYSYLIPSK